jgi:hypothetical protein
LQRLNITNGDSAAGTLSEAGIEGKIIAWRDVLHEGPVDSSLSLEELSKQRARFISEQGWDDFAHVSGDFEERDHVIRHLDYFDEVVLWFEDDLYDQLQLIQLLDFFAGGAGGRRRVSVIVVDGYIPPLSSEELKILDKKRPLVTAAQLDLAKRAWKAFGSPDPTSISRLLAEDTSALQYLARALTRHLEEFPSTVNGLSRSEGEALSVIAEGHNTPVRAFLEVAKKQESIFLGDIIFYSYLQRLSGKNDALVTWTDGSAVIAPTVKRAREFVEGELAVTPLGREVLAGKKDWQQINKKTRWLGGVEIPPGENGWRWNPIERQIVRDKSSDRQVSRGKSSPHKVVREKAATVPKRKAVRKKVAPVSKKQSRGAPTRRRKKK